MIHLAYHLSTLYASYTMQPIQYTTSNATQQLIWEAPLYGGNYELDHQMVHCIIQLPHQIWMDGFDKWHRGWKWTTGYDQSPVTQQWAVRKVQTNSRCQGTIENYVQKWSSIYIHLLCHSSQRVFNTLEDDECIITEQDKIDYLLDNIQCPTLASAVSHLAWHLTYMPISLMHPIPWPKKFFVYSHK